jgi:hypothetical protein
MAFIETMESTETGTETGVSIRVKFLLVRIASTRFHILGCFIVVAGCHAAEFVA